MLQSQLGVFYDCMKYPQVMQYNIPCIVPLSDDINLDRVEAALQTIFTARKELHTRFLIYENGEPRQYIAENKTLSLLRPLMAYNLSNTHQMRWIEADNDYTTQVLYRYGFQWPITARSYVHRFVDTIIGFDYFKS